MIRILALGTCCLIGCGGLLHAQNTQKNLAPPGPTATSPTPGDTPSPTPSPQASPESKPQPTPRLTRRELVDSLSEDDIRRALEGIRKEFLDPSATSDSALQRATLEGLLTRLAPGAKLSANPADDTPEAFPFLAEILDSHIGYIRPGNLDAAALSQFDTALASFRTKNVGALVIDLRSTGDDGDFETVAEFARRFVDKGKLLFTVQKPTAKQERILTSNQEAVSQGPLVVLTDSHTTGGAEAVAGTLRENAGAIIIGSDTAGSAVEFATIPLSGGRQLQVAVSQILLPTSGSIFPKGVRPDIAISLNPETQSEIFMKSTEGGVSQFVFDTERRRLNEASLVANLNPEIEEAAKGSSSRSANTLRDTVLQRAVDLVTALRFYRKPPPTP
ncbi:MAG: hypothetical protein Fur0032_02960 [Terrimicrobiaceae bacterium]